MEQPYRLYCGDALALALNLDYTAHIVLCSPPYFHKRKYGNDPEFEIGQESGPNTEQAVLHYIANLKRLFDSIRLHPRGSLWVNLGDTRDDKTRQLLMVPERFARHMQIGGWKLADTVIWAKVMADDDGTTEGQCMIEPATDRLNGNGYEYLYRFTKCKIGEAWTDVYSVMLPRAGAGTVRYLPETLMKSVSSTTGRCLQNVWRIPIETCKRKHYAPYPAALCERPIAMTCPMNVCANCGHIRSRLVTKRQYVEPTKGRNSRMFGKYTKGNDSQLQEQAGRRDLGRNYKPKMPVTVGWSECECKEWVRGLVLDPFVGSGSTAEAALKMGRRFLGFDLYQNYIDMAAQRCQETIQYLRANGLDPVALEQ